MRRPANGRRLVAIDHPVVVSRCRIIDADGRSLGDDDRHGDPLRQSLRVAGENLRQPEQAGRGFTVPLALDCLRFRRFGEYSLSQAKPLAPRQTATRSPTRDHASRSERRSNRCIWLSARSQASDQTTTSCLAGVNNASVRALSASNEWSLPLKA